MSALLSSSTSPLSSIPSITKFHLTSLTVVLATWHYKRCTCLVSLVWLALPVTLESRYLSDTSHAIRSSGGTSNIITLVCGVSQSSVLGPKMLIAYTEDINSIFSKHGIHHYEYADDTQTHLAVTRWNAPTVSPRLQNCLRYVGDFCGSRRLQLNANKTEVKWFRSSASLRGLTATENAVVIRNVNVQPVAYTEGKLRRGKFFQSFQPLSVSHAP